MRWASVRAVALGVMATTRVEAATFGTLAGLVEAAREDALRAEGVARRSSYRSRSSTRSAMRVPRSPHFTRNYRPTMAPPRTRW